jgi:hypothetical protein
VAAGFGDAQANGTYVQIGMYGGQPEYLNENGTYLFVNGGSLHYTMSYTDPLIDDTEQYEAASGVDPTAVWDVQAGTAPAGTVVPA